MLLRTVERFLRQNRVAPTVFGRAAAGDPCLVKDMRRGASCARRSMPGCAASWMAMRSPGERRCRLNSSPYREPPRPRAGLSPIACAWRSRSSEIIAASCCSHREKAWASITFAGARHTVTLLFASDEAVAAGEHFIAALPDHEFAIPGQLVADAIVTEVDHRLLPAPRLVVTCELLLLEEG